MSNEQQPQSEAPRYYPLHEVAKIFPEMDTIALTALVYDIRKNGVHEPIVLYQGKVIDGRNRQEACRRLGIPCPAVEWDGQGSLVKYVFSKNFHRRHLTSSQAAAVSARLLPLLREEAKKRRRRAGGDRKSPKAKEKSVPQGIGEAIPEQNGHAGEAVEEAAK